MSLMLAEIRVMAAGARGGRAQSVEKRNASGLTIWRREVAAACRLASLNPAFRHLANRARGTFFWSRRRRTLFLRATSFVNPPVHEHCCLWMLFDPSSIAVTEPSLCARAGFGIFFPLVAGGFPCSNGMHLELVGPFLRGTKVGVGQMIDEQSRAGEPNTEWPLLPPKAHASRVCGP